MREELFINVIGDVRRRVMDLSGDGSRSGLGHGFTALEVAKTSVGPEAQRKDNPTLSEGEEMVAE